MRIRIDLSYDGSDFNGWATQPGLPTVQADVEAALATALRIPEARVVCAGRTDAGVHARGQVLHVDIDDDVIAGSAGRRGQHPLAALQRRLNGILPSSIRIRRVTEAPPGFDARFSALWRRYAYRVVDSPADADPLLRRHHLVWERRLDLSLMNEASAQVLGRHDFASFCRRREGATTIRTLLEFGWERDASGVVEATVRADAFCHSMVRALVGCVLAVGDGRAAVSWPAEVLAEAARNGAVVVAEARGLTLEEVAYPADDELRARAELTRAKRVADVAESEAGNTGAGDSDG